MSEQNDLGDFLDMDTPNNNAIRPHQKMLKRALQNEKMGEEDIEVLNDLFESYRDMKETIGELDSEGRDKVDEKVDLYNEYKNEVALKVLEDAGTHLRRSKGQLKIESSITEEFLVDLMDEDIIPALEEADNYVTGPQNSLLSIDFIPEDISNIGDTSSINIETKDQDFVFGANVNYRLSTDDNFRNPETGDFTFSVLATECKRHIDKTMYREQIGTAGQLKQLVPFSRYYVVSDFLDMTPQNVKRTELDNVFVFRKAKRLPSGKRNDPDILREHLQNNPMDKNIVWKYVSEVKEFLGEQWYNPDRALDRGSFV